VPALLGGRLPVIVVTGFLGSGKTTLLNRLLADPGAPRVAVLVNELGEVGLDQVIFEPVAEEVVLIGGGCLCCNVRGDLLAALRTLVTGRQAGALPAFERVVVETTGLADPAPVLHTLMGAAGPLPGGVYLDGLVATVDGVHGGAQLGRFPEWARQVAFADRVVVTKTDLAPPEALAGLATRVAALNPGATLLWSGTEPLDPDAVLGPGASHPAGDGGWRRLGAAAGRVARGEHALGIQSFVVRRERPLSRSTLGRWLSELTERHGERLLRIKGLVDVDGAGGPLLVQAVQHRLYPPARLPAWPEGRRETRVVFIGEGDELPEAVEGALAAALGETAQALGEALPVGEVARA
jgi:G3E family GTPase